MIIYQLLRMSYARQTNGLDTNVLLFLPALILPCAAAYRLARFNLDDSQQYGFKGVPAPAAGLLVASLPLIYWYSNNGKIISLLLDKWVLYGIILVVAWLMVSKLPLMALKFRDYSLKSNMPKLILLLIAVVSAIFLKWLAVPVVFIFYIIVSLLFKNKTT